MRQAPARRGNRIINDPRGINPVSYDTHAV